MVKVADLAQHSQNRIFDGKISLFLMVQFSICFDIFFWGNYRVL
jgi:hypothetical protein